MRNLKRAIALVLLFTVAFLLPVSAYVYGRYEYEGTQECPMGVGLDEYYGNFSSDGDVHYYRITNNFWDYGEYVFSGLLITAKENYLSNTALLVSIDNPDGQKLEVKITDTDGKPVGDGCFTIEGSETGVYVFDGIPGGYYLVTVRRVSGEKPVTYTLKTERKDKLTGIQNYSLFEMISETASYWTEWFIGLFIRY